MGILTTSSHNADDAIRTYTNTASKNFVDEGNLTLQCWSMPPENSPNNTSLKEEGADTITLNWTSKVCGSFRGPFGLRTAIDNLLVEILAETGIKFSRNEFILNAIRYYIRYILQAKSIPDVTERLRQEFKLVDVEEEGSKVD